MRKNGKINGNLSTHLAPKSTQELVNTCTCIPDQAGIWKCWFLTSGETWSTQRKASRSKERNNNKLNAHDLCCYVWESNVGLIGGRQALSPLHHPCSLSVCFCSVKLNLSSSGPLDWTQMLTTNLHYRGGDDMRLDVTGTQRGQSIKSITIDTINKN